MPHSTQMRTRGFGGSDLPISFFRNVMTPPSFLPNRYVGRVGRVPGWDRPKCKIRSPMRRLWPLGPILVVALALRVWGIGFGLPNTYTRPDESRVVGTAA